jgi:hypothetical protein
MNDKNNRNQHWKNIVQKHGFTSQKLTEWANEKDAFAHEVLLIECFKAMGYELANYSNGGEGNSYPKTEATKIKISIAKKGVANPKMLGDLNPAKRPEIRLKRSISMKNFYQNGGVNPMSGKKRIDLIARNKQKSISGFEHFKSRSISLNGKIFGSMLQAANSIGISSHKLRYWALKDPQKYNTQFLDASMEKEKSCKLT